MGGSRIGLGEFSSVAVLAVVCAYTVVVVHLSTPAVQAQPAVAPQDVWHHHAEHDPCLHLALYDMKWVADQLKQLQLLVEANTSIAALQVCSVLSSSATSAAIMAWRGRCGGMC